MKTTIGKGAALLLLVLFSFSCSKDKDDNNNSRVVTYELSGNFTGARFASYTTAGGGTANESVASLPWSKLITYEGTVTAATFAISGNGGTPGQQLTLVIKKGGVVTSTTTATADNAGSFTRSALVMFF